MKGAVAELRALAVDRPDMVKSDLAKSLENLSRVYFALNRQKDALTAGRDALAMYQALAIEKPDVVRPDLASSFKNLSICYAALNLSDDALAASQESVQINRALAAELPLLFSPELAQSLSVMSDTFRAVRRNGEAAAATQEGLAAMAPLLQREPAIHASLCMMLAREHREASAEAGIEPDLCLLNRVYTLVANVQPLFEEGDAA